MSVTKKSQNTSYDWVEELLPLGYTQKRMFGGFAYYLADKIILVTFDSEGDRQYKNQTFDFDIWNGCLFPTERKHHTEIQKKFQKLIPHPVLGKWLYLPISTENFEVHIEDILEKIHKKSELFGVIPKKKKAKTQKQTTRKSFHTPQIFSSKSAVKKIESLKGRK